MKSNRISLILILCFSFVSFILPSHAAYADDSASLNITLTYEHKAISGAKYSIYQVADLKADRTGYVGIAPFQWNGNLEELKTVDAQIKLARRLERQSRNASAAMTLTTGRDGTVRFTGLRSGMYLVVQTGATGEAADYTTMQPFLVMAPRFENGVWNKVVNAKPKPEVQKKQKPKITKKVKTGDNSELFWWSGSLMLSVGLMALLVLRRKNKMGGVS